MKETGVVVPMVFAGVLLWERRARQAAWFALPALALLSWVAFLRYRTGFWAGSADFANYNLEYPLEPFRLAVSFLRRVYYLSLAGTHWIGTAALIYAGKKGLSIQTRSWRVAYMVVIAQAGVVVLLGGATLERYLLPVMPVVYAAMAAAIMFLPNVVRTMAALAMVAGLAAGNWINPPYPFPYEDNLALVDFVKLQQQAASYLAQFYPHSEVATVWPLTSELSDPRLGFVSRPLAVESLSDFTSESLTAGKRRGTTVLVSFSKTWDPPLSLMHLGPLRAVWQRHYGTIQLSRGRIAAEVTWQRVARFERRGQWVDVFVNPAAGKRKP
jgi:hypothetical protein